MIPLILGALAFPVMALYDIDRAFWRRGLWFFFPLGVLMLAAATAALCVGCRTEGTELWRLAFGGLAAEAFILLLYTQAAVLPDGTGGEKALFASGPYAACRHPGLWPFLLLYLSVWLYSGRREALISGAVFSALDLIYIIAQDVWLFPRYITGYREYKKNTPFLLPNAKSMKKAKP